MTNNVLIMLIPLYPNMEKELEDTPASVVIYGTSSSIELGEIYDKAQKAGVQSGYIISNDKEDFSSKPTITGIYLSGDTDELTEGLCLLNK